MACLTLEKSTYILRSTVLRTKVVHQVKASILFMIEVSSRDRLI